MLSEHAAIESWIVYWWSDLSNSCSSETERIKTSRSKSTGQYQRRAVTVLSCWEHFNPSKTEFLIFDLPQQLSKLNNLTIHLLNNVILNDRIRTAADDRRRRWSEIRNILHLTTNRQIRSDDDCTELSIGFATFFVEIIRRIKVAVSSRLENSCEDPLQCDVRHPTQMFTAIAPPSTDEIQTLIRSMPAKSFQQNTHIGRSSRRARTCSLHW